MMEEINKIPPVTRTLIFSTLVITLPTLLNIISPYNFFLWWPAVYGRGHIWRPITAFFYGGRGIQLLFDIFLLLRNSTDLETNKFYRKTADYAWALILICSLIVGTNYPLKSPVLFNPLLMAIVYLWSRANEHASVSLFGLINCPARYLPYAYLLFDLLRGGMPSAIQSATGLLSAHIYYFLKDVLPATNGGRGPNYLPITPSLLARLLPDSPDPNVRGQEAQQEGSVRSTSWGGTAFAPAGRSFGERQTAPSSQGQRLGSSNSGGIRSWLPFGGGGGSGSNSSSGNAARSTQNTVGRTQARPDREAMLAAAEARLQSLRANSIAGRNQAASAAASQAANSSEARARAAAASSRSQVPSSPAGNTLSGSQDSRTTARTEGSQAVRRAGAGSGGVNRPFSFGSAKETNSGEEQETASGSGGRVAEIRRAPSKDNDKDREDSEKVEHGWGSGQKLGN